MGSFMKNRVFDPFDLEIIDHVYEAAWAQLEAHEPFRDREKDDERERALKKRIFALAIPGHVDFDSLFEKVLAAMSQPLQPSQTSERSPPASQRLA